MLKVINLEAGYGALKVLDGVSLHVDKGELVAVFGGNGAGKTTLVKTLIGEIPLCEGRIIYQGKQLTHPVPETLARKGIVLIPEGRELFADLTVGENLKIGAYPRKSGRTTLRRTLNEVFNLFPILRERFSQKAGTLSGGEQQMLALARGMMSEPELLLLDEPSTGLAPKLVQELYRKIAHLKTRGVTMLLIEQNAHIALKYADRAYVMENGRIVLQGDSAKLANDTRIRSAYLGQ